VIQPQLAEFLQQGVGIYIGTRNALLEPNGARAIAARIEEDGARLIVYLADVAAERVLPDLHANGQAAVTFGRPVDERAVQVKGTFVAARAARDDEKPLLEAPSEDVPVLAEIFPGRRIEAALVWTDGPKLMPVPEKLMAESLAELSRTG